MNGAESLVKTMLAGGVDVCFANPGTSEMHFVAALDQHPEMRCVLCLFEGGATGAADGYFRMKGDVAATLLHLAGGFGNAFSNLHNARKAGSGIVNIVGDHATYHIKYESPLKGDLHGVSGAVSQWQRSSVDAGSVAIDGAEAIRAARSRNGQVSTLILPADTAWGEADGVAQVIAPPPLHRPSEAEIKAAAATLKKPGAVLLISNKALHGDLFLLAARVAETTGAALACPWLVPRLQRGAGAVQPTRLRPRIEMNIPIMENYQHIVMVGAHPPVSFFAYPDKPSLPQPPDCALYDLCGPEMDIAWTLNALADELDAGRTKAKAIAALAPPPLPSGALTLENIGQAYAALIPENAIVVDESITSGRGFHLPSRQSQPHDWLTNTGGSIGIGLPMAVGVAIAEPSRKVIALMGDGSAAYTLQSLWTMARENLDVTILIFANKGYQVLRGELANVGVEKVGRNAVNMLEVANPTLDWVSLAKGHGVEGARVETLDGFIRAFRAGLASQGPYLIEVPC